MLAEERPDLNIVMHDADTPFPRFVAEFPFDMVMLGPTFLGARISEKRLFNVQKIYGETIRNAGYRVALPQDDYDSSAVLDEWMTSWRIDTLYCVIPDRWQEIYPNYLEAGSILPGFTGYITDDWIAQWHEPKARERRRWDVTYRTHDRSSLYCDLRNLKFAIAERFRAAVGERSGLEMNISNRALDHIAGPDWHEFIEDSRFCLATPSGSSFLDPRGEIRKCVARHQAKNRGLTLSEARAACFPDASPSRPFSAISPRHIEAGLALTVQIATPGDYSGLMVADQHFLPLAEDCSNASEVMDRMKDESSCQLMATSFKESLLSEPRLRRSVIVDEIIRLAENAITAQNHVRASQADVDRLMNRYAAFVATHGRRYERMTHLRSRLVRFLDTSTPQLGNWLRRNVRP